MEQKGKLSRKLGLRPTLAELQAWRILALNEGVKVTNSSVTTRYTKPWARLRSTDKAVTNIELNELRSTETEACNGSIVHHEMWGYLETDIHHLWGQHHLLKTWQWSGIWKLNLRWRKGGLCFFLKCSSVVQPQWGSWVKGKMQWQWLSTVCYCLSYSWSGTLTKEDEQEAITGSLLSKNAGLKKIEEGNWWALERGGSRKKKEREKYFIMLTKKKLKHNCISEVSIWYLRIITRFENLTTQQGFLKDLVLDWLFQHYFGTIQYP